MKVFISHKQEDLFFAVMVKDALESCKVETYLDTLDDEISANSQELTKHIKEQISLCSDAFVILSNNTKESWWVPFEIGIATEKNMPIANYIVSDIKLPDYLDFWPTLKNDNDIKQYVDTRNEIRRVYHHEKYILESASCINTESETSEFYRKLKERLNGK